MDDTYFSTKKEVLFLTGFNITSSMVGGKWEFITISPAFKNAQFIRGAQKIFVEEQREYGIFEYLIDNISLDFL